jgi:hypothetical protein
MASHLYTFDLQLSAAAGRPELFVYPIEHCPPFHPLKAPMTAPMNFIELVARLTVNYLSKLSNIEQNHPA